MVRHLSFGRGSRCRVAPPLPRQAGASACRPEAKGNLAGCLSDDRDTARGHRGRFCRARTTSHGGGHHAAGAVDGGPISAGRSPPARAGAGRYRCAPPGADVPARGPAARGPNPQQVLLEHRPPSVGRRADALPALVGAFRRKIEQRDAPPRPKATPCRFGPGQNRRDPRDQHALDQPDHLRRRGPRPTVCRARSRADMALEQTR